MTTSTSTDTITLGPVELRVTDLARAGDFWEHLIGLVPLGDREDGALALGSGGRPLILLRPTATRPAAIGRGGLYHVAIHFPTPLELGRVLARLASAHWPLGTTDHLFSQSIYLRDPDGIGVELAYETPWRMREMLADAEHGLRAVDTDGNVRSPSGPLDLKPFLTAIEGADVAAPADGASVGHVHLSVPDIAAAVAFYRDGLGFEEHVTAPDVGIADLSAGGPFTHRIALNTFHGTGIAQAPADTAGMDRLTVRFTTSDAFEDARARLGDTHVTDPAGNAIVLAGR